VLREIWKEKELDPVDSNLVREKWGIQRQRKRQWYLWPTAPLMKICQEQNNIQN